VEKFDIVIFVRLGVMCCRTGPAFLHAFCVNIPHHILEIVCSPANALALRAQIRTTVSMVSSYRCLRRLIGSVADFSYVFCLLSLVTSVITTSLS